MDWGAWKGAGVWRDGLREERVGAMYGVSSDVICLSELNDREERRA